MIYLPGIPSCSGLTKVAKSATATATKAHTTTSTDPLIMMVLGVKENHIIFLREVRHDSPIFIQGNFLGENTCNII